ncbi:uncharacterized protein ccdc142 isoform X2 [Notolabrus celidotus]|uniref:uncharacterized protein ccdc142 isoform X2 n=1 Tax=Notolabrus celidotus TaxID=1203425 RepID=UPI00148F4E8A|nr:uncharacterized protein ccdc142 isoform X2 [Notolabrus celidotus]
MDHNNTELLRDPGGEPAPKTDRETSESSCPEREQRRPTPCSNNEDLNTDGSWSQRSISRSLQRAEMLLRSTLNPSLRWLFHVRNQDEEEEEEEGNFVLAHNLVSRSSARLLRLQQVLLTLGPQWLPVGGAGSTQVCVKGLSAEAAVLLLPPSSPSLQEAYLSLRRLQEQRSLLLFIHEFSRRARLAAAFISRVSHLLERAHLKLVQTRSCWSSFRVGLVSLSQELRVHVNHWSCLFSKVQSDQNLRRAVVRQTQLLQKVHQSLDLLGLQALVLMERFVFLVLSAVARSDLDSVPREVLEDVLAGTELYNQAVGEQRAQHSATQLRTTVLQQAQHPTLGPGLPCSRGCHPAGVSVRELMAVLAEHQAERVARQLHAWTSDLSDTCWVHRVLTGLEPSANQGVHCGTRTVGSEWTWDQLQHMYPTAFITHQPPLQPSAPKSSSQKSPPGLLSDLHLDQENHHPGSKSSPVQHKTEPTNRDQTSQCQTLKQTSPQTLVSDRQTSLEPSPPQSVPLSGVPQDRVSVELLHQLLVSSGELLAPLTSRTHEHLSPSTEPEETSPQGRTAQVFNPKLEESERLRLELNQDQVDADPERWTESASEVPGCVRWSPSVQWLDLGQSVVFAEVMAKYRPLLVTLCSRALWLQLVAPPTPKSAESINLQEPPSRTRILHRVWQAAETDLLPQEFRDMLQDFSLYLLASTAHAQWDHEVCSALGSSLKDRCLTDISRQLSSEQDGGVMMSSTMEHFLRLPPPLLSSLSSCQSNSRSSGPLSLPPSRLSLHRHTVSLAVATVQLSSVWVMSKSLQFLSSWSLIKFLLITQGDLKVLTVSLESMLHHTQSLMMKTLNSQSALHQQQQQHLQLRQQLRNLDRAVSNLQTFSGVVLKTFSKDCKMISGEIFEQTMPTAVHWRPSLRTGFPSSPSEYASLAAQTVIGQVLEGVAPLSEDARVQALSITMTAFMEAWMEHILRHKIKFSVQGALQLKQDFDSIREMIQSERYGLSADLHHRLLGLRVFQKVDSAVVCLLQQPQAKPYLQSRTWEPFTHCCPAHSSTDSIDSVVGSSSITNLRCMDGEELTDPSMVTSDLPPVDPSTPEEPYLAPSAALGSAQQDWLDLRIHSTARRWRLPGLHCLSKSEP